MNSKLKHRWMADSICIVLLVSLTNLSRALAVEDEVFDPSTICPAVIPIEQVLVPVEARSGTLQSEGDEAEWVMCVPQDGLWNGDLVLYAHGTIRVFAEPGKIEAVLPQLDFAGVSLPAFINLTGHAFAVVARSKTGLSVKEGVAEINRLYEIFIEEFGAPFHTYVVGVSQGGQVAALSVEDMENDQFDGAISACGPIGNFRKQLSYFFDFLVLFEYFFRNELLDIGIVFLKRDGNGDPHVPEVVVENWEGEGGVKEQILGVMEQNTEKLSELLKVAKVPSDPTGEKDAIEIGEELLEATALGVNDTITTLGGNAYENRNRFYFGSTQDLQLNLGVQRFGADREALNELLAHYETSGKLNNHLVALHTLLDPRVPFWHVLRYRLKSFLRRTSAFYAVLPIPRFGHCDFEPKEALAAFALLVSKVTGFDSIEPDTVFLNIATLPVDSALPPHEVLNP